MRDIAALVFGSEPAGPRAPREPREPRAPRALRAPRAPRSPREQSATRDARICDGQPAPSGDWCQTTPGHAALEWFAFTLGAGNRKHRP
jgi:hypothetical protein